MVVAAVSSSTIGPQRPHVSVTTTARYSRNDRTIFFRQKEGQFETKKVCITKVIQTFHFLCTPSGIRTLDPLIKSQLLYQLS